MNNLSITHATLAQENIVFEMANAFHLEDGHPLARSSFTAIRNALVGSELGKIFLVERDGVALGYFVLCFTLSIELGGLVVILDDFYLRPEFRQGGIGTFLLEEIKKISWSMNAVQISLEVESANERARHFYTRNGFKIRDRNLMDFRPTEKK